MIRIRKSVVATLITVAAVAVIGVSVAHGGPSTAFNPPVKVTPDLGFGYEPATVVDGYGNIFVTAHKENWQLALAPDANSPTYTRSMSWVWTSVDGGKSFVDPPGLTGISIEQHQFGDEGDLAFDDAHHLYFVDTNVADDTIARWSVTGPGLANMSLDFTRPLVPTAQLVDDRPWVTAHGNGHVFYLGNEGDKVTYPLGQGSGSGFGPGRYTVYQSYDGGQTFDPLGYTLKDSGWCRPAADHAPGSPYVYAVCTNDGGSDDVTTDVNKTGTIWAYVSSDDGHSFSRYKVGSYAALDSTTSWPTVEVAPDGSIWALYVDGRLDSNGDPITNRLVLFHSTNHGQTWTKRDITPLTGRYEYAWLSVSPDGSKLGLGVYYRPNNNSDWRVYGSIFASGAKPTLVSLDQNNPVAPASASQAPGDLMGSHFNPDGTLGVVWTRDVLRADGVATLERDIYYARSK